MPLRIGHVIRRMRSGCKRIVDGILWEMSELITQEWIAVGSSNLGNNLSEKIHDRYTQLFIISGPFDKISIALLINVISVQKVTVCGSDNITHNLLKNDFHCAIFTL